MLIAKLHKVAMIRGLMKYRALSRQVGLPVPKKMTSIKRL